MGWTSNKKHTIHDYLENATGWPRGFFAKHSAEELGLTEEERAELIKMQNKAIAFADGDSEYRAKVIREREEEAAKKAETLRMFESLDATLNKNT